MSFFSDIFATVKKKKAELEDRREFLNMVEKKQNRLEEQHICNRC